MKARDFLILVGATLTAQQDYYALKRQGKKDLATAALIRAKGLEKRCWAIVNGGVLEPDVVTTVEIVEPTTELDFVASQRPNVAEQNTLFAEGE